MASTTDQPRPTLRAEIDPELEAEFGDGSLQLRGSLQDIEQVRALAKAHPAKHFATEIGRWWIVKKPGRAKLGAAPDGAEAGSEITLVGLSGDLLSDIAEHREAGWTCCPVIKRADSEMQRITVGRGPQCDIVLRYPRISRLHASFEISEDGIIDLADNGSANGTTLGGQPLRGGPVGIPNGAPVEFGNVEFTLISGESLHAALCA